MSQDKNGEIPLDRSPAIAQHCPGYALVGNPSTIAGTIAAHPGDTLILWPTGIVVTGAPAIATLPIITVGGIQVTVLNTVLSPNSPGLHQVAIQLPPPGVAALQASMAGVTSPTGVNLFASGQ